MNFECPEAERRFRQHQHSSRTASDALFAATQLAITTVLALHEGPGSLPRHLRLLCWATQGVGAAVLALALLSRRHPSCARLRPYILVSARLLFHMLCPHVVWQVASAGSARSSKAGEDETASWTGLFLLWVSWSRWGGQLLIQLWHQLPFNTEALLAPFGVLMDMLNNRRLCRLLTESAAEPRRAFFRAAFSRLALLLSAPARLLLPSWAASGACAWDGSAASDGTLAASCSWSICSTEVQGSGSSYGPAGSAAPQAEHVATCLCEGVFGLSQLLLSLALPLLLLGWSEVRARRQFAAAERYRQREAARLARIFGAGEVDVQLQHTLQHLLRGQQQLQQQPQGAAADSACIPPSGWLITFDRMRLLLALALIEFKVLMSLRSSEWPQFAWLRGSDAAAGGVAVAVAASAAAQPHLEL
ncbi:hypothetical protein ABPG75_007140 [Micractinium tetrahymenae]